MKIENLKLSEVKPYEKNPRRNDAAVNGVAESIRQFGFRQPLVVDANGVIVVGHTRYKAAKKLGLKTVPCVRADDLDETKVAAYRLADNKLNEVAEWDVDLLEELLPEIDFDFSTLDIDFSDLLSDSPTSADKFRDAKEGGLVERFLVFPSTVLDTRKASWIKRQRLWKRFINSGAGRSDSLLGGLKSLAKNSNQKLSGTSIFDPVLCELLIQWFSPLGGSIVDPFAGGSVRGIVSAALGRRYFGVDVSSSQIEANRLAVGDLAKETDLFGAPIIPPEYVLGDARDIKNFIGDRSFDFLLSCPPYFDLEKYTDDKKDLSSLTYNEFCVAYRQIYADAFSALKNDSFAAVVVGDVRDPKGVYRDLVGLTIDAFRQAGGVFYNSAILVNSVSTLALRVNRQFAATRKLGKQHQNVLVFLKGDAKRATAKLPEIQDVLPEDEEDVL